MSWRVIVTGAVYILFAALLSIFAAALKTKVPFLPVIAVAATIPVILAGWKTILDMIQTTNALQRYGPEVEKLVLEIKKLHLEIGDKEKTLQKQDAYVEVATFSQTTQYASRLRNISPLIALPFACLIYGVSTHLGSWEPVLESKTQVAADKTRLAQQESDIEKAKRETQRVQASAEKSNEEIKKQYELLAAQEKKERAKAEIESEARAARTIARVESSKREAIANDEARLEEQARVGQLVLSRKDRELAAIQRLSAQKDAALTSALKDYDQAIQLRPNDSVMYGKRAEAEYTLGKFTEAVGDYNKAIELNSGDAVAYAGRAEARYAQGDVGGAVGDYGKAIELKPDFAEAFFNRSLVRRALGDSAAAAADYKEAIRLGYKPPKGMEEKKLIPY